MISFLVLSKEQFQKFDPGIRYTKKNISRFDELMEKIFFNNNQGSNRESLWNDYPYSVKIKT
jgi:hypothetical protein